LLRSRCPQSPWLSSAQDFERYYDAGLGIRHQPKGDGDDDDDDKEDAPPGSGPADSARANGGADLAVFEQYERLVIN
jgi:katanin p60 ATPase-containing subunit A1